MIKSLEVERLFQVIFYLEDLIFLLQMKEGRIFYILIIMEILLNLRKIMLLMIPFKTAVELR